MERTEICAGKDGEPDVRIYCDQSVRNEVQGI